jgi:PAS domain S-box-containing protein
MREALERASPVCLFLTDRAGACLYVNPRWSELTGLPGDEALGAGWARALHPDDRDRIFAVWLRAAETQGIFAEEYRFLRSDGAVVWAYGQAVPQFDAAGELVGHVGSVTDMSEPRRAKERLRQSELHLAALIHQSLAGIAETDLTGRFTLVNDRYCQITGYARDELLAGVRMQDITHPDDLPRNVALFQRLVADGTPFTIEKRYVRKDGSFVWVGNCISATRDGGSPPRSVVAVVVDITERKQGEAALRENEERLRLGMELAGFALAEIDYAASVIHLSAEAARLYGLGDHAMTVPRARVHTTVHPEDRDDLRRRIARSEDPDAEPSPATDYRVVWPSGEVRWLSVRNQIEFDRSGPVSRPRRGMLAVLDVTERTRAEAERMAFADAAAHDLRNPLTTLKGQTQLLLRRARHGQLADTTKLESGLESIDAAANRMIVLIDEMMDAAHLRAGRSLDLQLAPIDLVALASAAVEETRRRTARQMLRVETRLPSLPGTWDSARMARVLGNLLDNAVKYSPRGGEIVVRVAREETAHGSWAVLAISDRGIGIPAADLPHLFTRFGRGGNVAAIGGTGFGLFGVKQIVEQHGGTVTAESVEGQGSTFTVRLPLPTDSA